jgi:ligand-binding sensor domain-containing protein
MRAASHIERPMIRSLVRGAPAAGVMRAFVLAVACTTTAYATISEANDGTIGPSGMLRYEVVRAILQDSKGNYWFGAWSEGVCRFDGESLTYFTVDDGLTHNQIRSIREDRNGVVWFEGAIGISGFDGEKIITPAHKNYASKDDWKLEAGDVWFKEDGDIGPTELEDRPGVYRYDGTTFTYLAYPVTVDRDRVTAYAATAMATGKSGRVWFATYAAVIGYDGKSFTIIDDKSLGLDESTGWLHVRSVLEDSKGNLWIGNNGIGVILHDGTAATQFTQEKGLGKMGSHGGRATPLPGDVTDGSPTMHRVFSIGEDREGNIWFGTIENGAWRYDGKSLRNYTAADGLTSKDIMCIYTDRHGDLWLSGNGVFKFNGTSFDRIH